MTRGLIRGYAAALSLLGFASAWAATARSPWPSTPAPSIETATGPVAADARVAALDRREARLRALARRVQAMRADQQQQAARPAQAVRVVQQPAVTQTRSS